MAAIGEELERLVRIMARLRGEGGCPWDREQDLRSLRPYLIEEAYEVLDEMDRVSYGGPWRPLCEELGDLLFQIVFHSQLASEKSEFMMADVCRAISDKIESRHPHVFGDVRVRGSEQVLENWAKLKAEEKRKKTGSEGSVLDGVPSGAPALQRAERLTEKASRIGFDWPDVASVRAKVDEELRELDQAVARGDRDAIEAELGDVLFSLVNLARFVNTPPEDALRQANRRFTSRFHQIEAGLRAEGVPFGKATLAQMEAWWQKAKQAEQQVPPPREAPRASVGELRVGTQRIEDVQRFWDRLAEAIGWRKERAAPGELRYSGGALAVVFTSGPALGPGWVQLSLDAWSRGHVDALHHKLAEWGAPELSAPRQVPSPDGRSTLHAVDFQDPAGLRWRCAWPEGALGR